MSGFLPQKPEKDVISIRISTAVLSEIDKLASDIDISRNELINQCIEFALHNLDTNSIKKIEKSALD